MIPELEKRSIVREVRAEGGSDAQPTRIVGYAAVFDEVSELPSLWREVIRKGAFRQSLEDRADVVALFNHNESLIIGRTSAGTLTIEEDDIGLRYEILPPETTVAADLITSIKRGDLRGASFSFRVRKQQWTEEPGMLDLRELIDIELGDVSIVTFAQYDGTDVSMRSRDAWKREHDAHLAAKSAHRERTLTLAETD